MYNMASVQTSLDQKGYMRKLHSHTLVLPFLLIACLYAVSQSQYKPATIEGTVYDPHEAVFVGVTISAENVSTGEVISVKTDDVGHYSLEVAPGRYKVTMRPQVGMPTGYEHSSFYISPGENVLINFRPTAFLSISSGFFEDNQYTSRYEGALPSIITHFIIHPKRLLVQDIRIQYAEATNKGDLIQYKGAIASFDRLTISASEISFDPKERRVVATGNVVFEDGKKVHKANRVEIDLITNEVMIGPSTR
jgi:hypothetical protein